MCFYRSIGFSSKVVLQASINSRESSQPICSLICSGFEPFKPEEQLLSAKGAIFLTTDLVTPLGNSENLSWSDLPQFLKSCPNPGSISNSLQSDFPSDSVSFGLKLLDLFISELFQPFMLFFTVNPSIFSLIWSISNLIFHSSCVLDLFREPHMCLWQGAVPLLESS